MVMRTSILDGMDAATLQQRLTHMQNAYLDLLSGAKVEVASYSQSDGSRTITYTTANMADLTAAILAVQSALDRLSGACINRRAPMRPVYR